MVLHVRQLAGRDPAFDDCFAIRIAVFVHEQNVPAEEERDGLDEAALHFLALQDGVPVGTARAMLKPDGSVKISRVAVIKPARGRGIGAALLRAVEAELPLASTYVLDAQVTALRFYERLGYAATGAVFMEAGMAHRHMTKPGGAAQTF